MEDNVISESENWKSNKVLGYKELVLKQIAKCLDNLSKEQVRGYWVYSEKINQTSEKKKYVGDARKETIQSIETLYDLLLPKFDKIIKEETKDFDKKVEEDIKNYKLDKSNETDTFWKIKRKHYRKLFQQICFFLDRIGWLETQAMEDD